MTENQEPNLFDRLLDVAASSAPTVALEIEAEGLRATPVLIAAVIACVLAKTWDDEKKRNEWALLLLPHVEKHLAPPKT